MYGFAAISANNGWSIAIVGAAIVFSGLVFLSFTISRLHKILEFLENRDEHVRRIKTRLTTRGAVKKSFTYDIAEPEEFDIKELTAQYDMLIRVAGDSFSLPKLIEIAEKRGLAHPHASINALLTAGVLEADGAGTYHWNQDVHDRIIKG